MTRPGEAPTVGTMGHYRELRMEHIHTIGRILLAIGLFMISFQAAALPKIVQDISNETFWFRILLGVAIGACGWILSKHDSKIDKLMSENLPSRLTYMEMEWRNVSSEISMLREKLPREYHSKTDMDRRFDKIDVMVTAIHKRLDHLVDTVHAPSRSVSSHGE